MNQPGHDHSSACSTSCRRVLILAAIGLAIFVAAGLARCLIGFEPDDIQRMFKIQTLHDITRQAMWLGTVLMAVAGYGYIRLPDRHD